MPASSNRGVFEVKRFHGILQYLVPARVSIRPMKQLVFIYVLLCCGLYAGAQNHPLVARDSVNQALWVKGLLPSMSTAEKVGQLFMVMVPSEPTNAQLTQIDDWVSRGMVGGLIFSKSTPEEVHRLVLRFQERACVPLLMAIDAEWGLAMRLQGSAAFPWNMALGAVQDTTLLFDMGARIGKEARNLGIHMNFAPVVDINTNPDNPIIGNRSLGEDPWQVSRRAAALMEGMQSEGVLTCLKHFPGHGDTSVDSHKKLPIVGHGRDRLDSVELRPYRELIGRGASSVMVGHLSLPALESAEGLPSTLSSKVIKGLLIGDLGFKGLVVTDALNMKAVSDFAPAGEVELSAFQAGNDLLLMPYDLEAAYNRIIQAVETGELNELRLSTSVQKILMAKAKAGLNTFEAVFRPNEFSGADEPAAAALNEELVEASLTLVKDPLSLIPIQPLERSRIAYVGLGMGRGAVFLEHLRKYAQVDEIRVEELIDATTPLDGYTTVIFGHHTDPGSPYTSYKLAPTEYRLLEKVSGYPGSNCMLVSFASPYSLKGVAEIKGMDAILCAYQNSDLAQRKAAEAVFGALGLSGRLPVGLSDQIGAGHGIRRNAIGRLGFSTPERVGVSSYELARIDTLVLQGIDSAMYPGAQLLVARRGKVIYEKSFGSFTYEGKRPVHTDDLYDLASLTKILATLPLLMKMEEEGRLGLDQHFDELLPEFRRSELGDVSVLRALSHYGGLPAWIAFYVNTLGKDRRPSPELYRNRPQEGFNTQVSEGLFIMDSYRDSMYTRIVEQERKSNRYRYSDIGYYVFKKYIEQSYGTTLDRLADSLLYRPMGATHTFFNPLNRVPRERIVPSEEDNYFRYGRVQGHVHDMGAAMLGGVGGHAGLFGNALDVAKIMQMYLQGGYYGGRNYLKTRTIDKFNTCYFCDRKVRRGVGFDKPQLVEHGPTCGCVSYSSFGHSGFTGTYTWADPQEQIVYVFLSNRTYPSSRNNLLISSELRTRIQKVIYEALD